MPNFATHTIYFELMRNNVLIVGLMWSSKPEAISDPKIASWHAATINLKANVLGMEGCTEGALSTIKQVHDIVVVFVSTSQRSFYEMVDSMVQESRLLVSQGDNEGALQVAEEALRLSRDNKLEPVEETLVWSSYAISFATLSCQDYKLALEAAQEGCSLSAHQNWQENEEEHNIFIGLSLFAILSSAEANLTRHHTALEHAYRAVDLSLDIRGRKSDMSATAAEESYMETRGNLAEILMATGELARAREICEERRAYFSKRIEKRMGDYRDLAPILRMLGVLCCADGRHKEGGASAQELCRIVKTLGFSFPSIQEQVKIRLRYQAKVLILKVLDIMTQNLDCKHQAEVSSLYEI